MFIIGLLILGPERLPRVASKVGRWIGKARRTANQLRYQLEREIALADLQKSARGENEKPETPDNQHNESAREEEEGTGDVAADRDQVAESTEAASKNNKS